MPRARQRQNDRGIVHELIQTFIAVSLYGLFLGTNKEHHHHYHKSEAPQQTKPYQSRSSSVKWLKIERSMENERPADWRVAEAEKAALESAARAFSFPKKFPAEQEKTKTLAKSLESEIKLDNDIVAADAIEDTPVTDQSDVGLSGVHNSADDSTET